MRSLTLFLLLAVSCPVAGRAGTPEAAAQIRNEYEEAVRVWAQKLALADSQSQRNVWKNRPQSSDYGARMWIELKDSLRTDWTIEYCTWLLERAPVFVAETDPGESRSRAQFII
ncbi:MAG: hypothetical protein QGH41_08520, partial [Roseibacillus sp.]|nr:hypothetical protein [Roseibacillus sp.]